MTDSSPWLHTPLADYEAHMALPNVAQAPLIAAEMRRAATQHHASSVAILGCAGGNGLPELAAAGVSRIVAIDINPDYLAVARERHAHRFQQFETLVGDCARETFACEPVDLVFAGLIFEFVPAGAVFACAEAMLEPAGAVVAMIQLPSAIAEVTPSPYAASLGPVGRAMTLVAPDALAAAAAGVGFERIEERTAAVPGGKAFQVSAFGRGSGF